MPCLAGTLHVCAVDGTALAWCWGDGVNGQLGTGEKGKGEGGNYYKSTAPVPVAAVNGSAIPFYSISAGGEHTCGVSPRAAVVASPPPSPVAPSPEIVAVPSPSPAPPSPASPSPQVVAVPSPSPSAPPAPSPPVGAPGTSSPPPGEPLNNPPQVVPPSTSSFPIGAVVGAVAGAAGEVRCYPAAAACMLSWYMILNPPVCPAPLQ